MKLFREFSTQKVFYIEGIYFQIVFLLTFYPFSFFFLRMHWCTYYQLLSLIYYYFVIVGTESVHKLLNDFDVLIHYYIKVSLSILYTFYIKVKKLKCYCYLLMKILLILKLINFITLTSVFYAMPKSLIFIIRARPINKVLSKRRKHEIS